MPSFIGHIHINRHTEAPWLSGSHLIESCCKTFFFYLYLMSVLHRSLTITLSPCSHFYVHWDIFPFSHVALIANKMLTHAGDVLINWENMNKHRHAEVSLIESCCRSCYLSLAQPNKLIAALLLASVRHPQMYIFTHCYIICFYLCTWIITRQQLQNLTNLY